MCGGGGGVLGGGGGVLGYSFLKTHSFVQFSSRHHRPHTLKAKDMYL